MSLEREYLLFVYGTLKDTEIQKLLLGREVKTERAILRDHAVYVDKSGYYFLKKEEGSFAKGLILHVTEEELRKIDLWEEVPEQYYRVSVTAQVNEKEVDCFVYLKDAESEIRAPEEEIANVPKEKILEEIRRLVQTRNYEKGRLF
ncbi:MAG: gamma-glutamylcyclotransferase [Leptospiraceae bacterium]|nr:gamma-glutamylcyclotransferase [Leptospiraceae bacterium]